MDAILVPLEQWTLNMSPDWRFFITYFRCCSSRVTAVRQTGSDDRLLLGNAQVQHQLITSLAPLGGWNTNYSFLRPRGLKTPLNFKNFCADYSVNFIQKTESDYRLYNPFYVSVCPKKSFFQQKSRALWWCTVKKTKTLLLYFLNGYRYYKCF